VTPRRKLGNQLEGKMSFFKIGLNSLLEVLVLVLMFVSIFALFYSDIDFTYKIGIAVLAFSIIFLTSLASQVLKQEQEKQKRRN
jgi:hypothetical protein